MLQQAPQTSKKPLKESKRFRVQQWDKNQMSTFLLGDYLGCCLATNGGMFPAMVQRRMDKAMFMHVVYDEELNEPVCGNWLFFGYDKKNPKDIYVVANFFEIRQSHAMDANMRDLLVQKLKEFTADYAKEINAKGFIIRPLEYGLIPDFKEQHETVALELEKVGGYFSGNARSNDYSKDLYYLDALNTTNFYLCESNKPRLLPDISSTLPQTLHAKKRTLNLKPTPLNSRKLLGPTNGLPPV